MFILGLRFCLFAIFAVGTVSAAEISLNTLSCSGTSQFEADQAAILDCSGDFILGDGFIYSDQSISISADGMLRLDNIQLSAPQINLIGGTGIYIGEGVSIEGEFLRLGVNATAIPVEGNDAHAVISWVDYDIGDGNSILYLNPSNSGLTPIDIGGAILTPVPLPSSAWLLFSCIGLLFIKPKHYCPTNMGKG